ncbi:MAG: hypothetical protein K2Q21_05510 [Chitinophagaceae bacterium]|nr:hypothetical protein [Chitinophagaceae bacterium]
MQAFRFLILFLFLAAMQGKLFAQTDTSKRVTATTLSAKKDSLKKGASDSIPVKKHDPRKATRRSAMIPGWGQAYNKEYWKIPLVYAAVGIPVGLFVYNTSWYKKTKFAYEAKYKASVDPTDTADLKQIDPQLVNLSTASLQSYRNSFRRDRDYSVLFFLLAWGLNVVDATVFAHLKEFDVSSDLSMQVKPAFNPTTRSTGLTFTFTSRKPEHKLYEVR